MRLRERIPGLRNSSVGTLVFGDMSEEHEGYIDTHFLLIHRKEAPEGALALPAGRVENSDKTLAEAATREVYEELGITISPDKLVPIVDNWKFEPKWPKTLGKRQVIFICQVAPQVMMNVVDWKKDRMPINNRDLGDWDSHFYFGEPKTNPEEVSKVYAFYYTALIYLLESWKHPQYFGPEVTPVGIFKEELLQKAALWAYRNGNPKTGLPLPPY